MLDEQTRKDAARYRWLRENLHRLTVDSYETLDGTIGMRSIVLKIYVRDWTAPAKPTTIDEAVDKVMQEFEILEENLRD